MEQTPNIPPDPQPKGNGTRGLGQAIGRTVESIERVVTGLVVPRRFQKGAPGATPGIEASELPHRPSSDRKVYISCTDYSHDQVRVQTVDDLEDFIIHHRPDWANVRWINIDGLSDMGVVHAFATKYDLHPLAIEDLLHVPQRPKVDSYGGEDSPMLARLFIICRMLQLREHHLHSEQISIFLGHKTVLTFQETHGDVWDPIRSRLNVKGSRLRVNDASFLVYALIDAIVDHCFPILEHYGDRLHELEESLLEHPDVTTIHQIHDLNRELMLLRRAVWPMRDVVQTLQREPHECMSDTTRTYLRDVYDHTVQIIDMIETYRELAASLAETLATMMGNKLNEVVKVLTVLTAVFVPGTFLASVYGMNFKYLPELDWKYSYALFWCLTIGSAAGMILWFKRRGWL